MEKSARLFNCVRCQQQVVICRVCDRANIYCSTDCSRTARRIACRAAGLRYQATHRGRLKHAARQRRYRQRQKEKVTHQGSSTLPPHDVLPSTPNEQEKPLEQNLCCHFCGQSCSAFLRVGFLRRYVRDKNASWPLGP